MTKNAWRRKWSNHATTIGVKDPAETEIAEDVDEDDDDDADVKPLPENGGNLFVCQSAEQRWLLSCYDNEIAFLDATYMTTQYTLPLFFLVVKTNVD